MVKLYNFIMESTYIELHLNDRYKCAGPREGGEREREREGKQASKHHEQQPYIFYYMIVR